MALWAWSEAEGETSSTEGILVGPKLCARPGVFPNKGCLGLVSQDLAMSLCKTKLLEPVSEGVCVCEVTSVVYNSF